MAGRLTICAGLAGLALAGPAGAQGAQAQRLPVVEAPPEPASGSHTVSVRVKITSDPTAHCSLACRPGKAHTWDCPAGQQCDGDCTPQGKPVGRCKAAR